MASLRQRVVLPLFMLVGLLSVAANARPGLHFHPCNTLLISYSFSLDRQNPNPNSPHFLTIFTHFTEFHPKPSAIFLDRPNFLLPDDEPEIPRPGFFPRSSSSSVVSSIRDRTKDIISVVVALLFGVGCGFLTAATIYLAWSLFSSRYYDLHNSYEDDDGDVNPKKMGYVKIPASDAAVASSAKAAGLGTKNLQSFISQFIYFYGYSFFKRLYLERSGNKTIGTKANLIVAAAAGACTVIVTQPLDTASSRMQTSEFGKSKGLWKTLSEGTWSEAFDGLGVSLLLTSNPSIQYTLFDQLKQRLLRRQQSKMGTKSSPEALSASSAFMLGAVSKCIATTLTYPAIRCKVMIQAAESDEDGARGQTEPQKTVLGALHSIWKREGVLGFFKGLRAQILKTVLSSALLLMIKEKITKTTWVLMLALRRYLCLTQTRLKGA